MKDKAYVVPSFAVEQANALGSEFESKFVDKFIVGQHKHGGNVMQMGGQRLAYEAECEVLDQWSYVQGMKHAMKDAFNLIEAALTTEDEEDASEYLMEAQERLDN